ncbi:MAG: LysR family transcriptional regulator [Firmicutes bacterium]|nr:LysR family transcriptional regulator [Bacillota bacterium]
MELLQLRYFVTVAKMQSITKAANYYGIPQPAMSQTIARLEADLGGIRLFDRKNSRIYLNETGKRFLSRVEYALHSLDNGIAELNTQSDTISGEIHLLVLENRRFILSCVSQFYKRYPDVTFFVSHDFHSDQNTDYDLCVSCMQTHHHMKHSVPLVKESIVLAVHESNPLAKRSWVSLPELKDEKFITMPSQSSQYDITYNSCRACGFEPRVQFICDDPYFVRKYISENMGVALSPAVSWSERFRKNTVIVPIENPPIHTTSYLLWDDNRYMTPTVSEFMKFVIEQAKHLEGNLLNQSVIG